MATDKYRVVNADNISVSKRDRRYKRQHELREIMKSPEWVQGAASETTKRSKNRA